MTVYICLCYRNQVDYCNRGAGCGVGRGHRDRRCVRLQTQSKVSLSSSCSLLSALGTLTPISLLFSMSLLLFSHKRVVKPGLQVP